MKKYFLALSLMSSSLIANADVHFNIDIVKKINNFIGSQLYRDKFSVKKKVYVDPSTGKEYFEFKRGMSLIPGKFSYNVVRGNHSSIINYSDKKDVLFSGTTTINFNCKKIGGYAENISDSLDDYPFQITFNWELVDNESFSLICNCNKQKFKILSIEKPVFISADSEINSVTLKHCSKKFLKNINEFKNKKISKEFLDSDSDIGTTTLSKYDMYDEEYYY